MAYSSKESTLEHKVLISKLMGDVIGKLIDRASLHDNTKLLEPELSCFDSMTPKLSKSTYGSDEYNGFLKELKPALEHHYAKYRHHPEHFPEGCRGMNIIDILEMFIDWKASSLRHNDGNILKSIDVNRSRFSLDKVSVYDILLNSVELFE